MPKDEYMRDSVIQRFEFCVELAWKVSKKSMGTSTTNMQNLSSHTYNEELAERVYHFAVAFLPELHSLKAKLESK